MKDVNRGNYLGELLEFSCMFRLLVCCAILWAVTSVCNATTTAAPSPDIIFPNATATQLLANWRNWTTLAEAREVASNRSSRVTRALALSAGVYNNASKAHALGLESSVMVTLLTLTDVVTSRSYLDVLKNWLCFTSHYGHKPLIYVVTADGQFDQPHVGDATSELQSHNPRSRFIDFPNALFWRLLSAKTNFNGHYGVKWRLDFRGSAPAHSHFGASLLKVVQMLEIVQSGYDVMYFDVDVAFVKDPVPLMTLGGSTVAITLESRTCKSTTFAEPTVKEVQPARLTEPNSGVIFVRVQRDPANATAVGRGVAFMQVYAKLMVNEHTSNDQFQLQTKSHGWYVLTTDCHVKYDRAFTLGADYNDSRQRQRRSHGQEPSPRLPSLCYLQDVLFSNGLLAFKCVQYNENTLRLNRLGRIGSAEGEGNSSQANASSRGLLTPLAALNVTGGMPAGADNDDFIAPVTVHANYCPIKAQCFSAAGLWLVVGDGNRSTCRPYDIQTTAFRQHQWYQRLARVENETLALLRLYPPGSVLKFWRHSAVYLVDAGPVIRLLPPEVLAQLGLKAARDVVTPDPWESNVLHEFMVVGDPLPTLDMGMFPACRIQRTNMTARANSSSGSHGGRTTTTTLPALLSLWKRGQLRSPSDCPGLE